MTFCAPRCLLLSLALLVAGPGSASAVERMIKRAFPVQPGVTVKVDTYRGGIIVEETEASEVRAEVRVEFATEDEAQASEGLEALKLEIEKVGNEVTVRARNPRESRAVFAWEEKKRAELTFRLFVPSGSSLNLTTLDGGVTVGNLTGQVAARTRAGTIFCKKIDGAVKAVVETGDIVVSRCTGALDLRVERGNIRTGTIFSAAKLRNDSGDIEVLSAFGGLDAATSAGDIVVGLQNGFTGDAKVEASGGSILAKIEPTAALTLDASTSWGRVQTKLPFALESGGAGKSKFRGKLNGGGPAVRLHAAGGHVRLEAYKQFLDLNEES